MPCGPKVLHLKLEPKVGIAHQSLFQVKGAVKVVGFQHVADAANEPLDPLPGRRLSANAERDFVGLE